MDYVCDEVIGKHVSNRDHVRGASVRTRSASPVLGPMAAHGGASPPRSVSSHLNNFFGLVGNSLLSEDPEGNQGEISSFHNFTTDLPKVS